MKSFDSERKHSELFIKSVEIDWDRIDPDSYLHSINAIDGLEHLDLHAPVTFFVGENGSGKSSTFDSHSELHDAVRVARGPKKAKWGYFLRAESFYNVATAEAEYSRLGGVPQHYHEKSHGESFLALVQSNFGPDGVYLLDEPEAALSPQRQLTLLLEIASCVQSGSQFIIVTHSPILLGLPDAEILSFDDGPVHPVSYEETDSYRVTEMFINNRKQILRRLLRTDRTEDDDIE